ncbi:MAG: single-stranded DNA-binding protein [Thermoplasmatales archaeon]|nr:single-stranded DNA-binding protein [Thermoplasmatales archaeon]
MKGNELTPHVEELKRVLGKKVSEEDIRAELDNFVNRFGVDVENAKKAIVRKLGDEGVSFITADAVKKKIGDLTGNEQSVDITAKVVFGESKDVTVRGQPKTIFSGILGDDTGTASFTVWEGEGVELETGAVYEFRNAYTRLWNERVQINVGNRGTIEASKERIETVPYSGGEPVDAKIGDLREGMGSVNVTGKVIDVERREITVRGEPRVVFSGKMADDTGNVQFSAWEDFGLVEGRTYTVSNAYVRAWRGIPQLNMGDRASVEEADADFGDAVGGPTESTISEIIAVGGGIDVSVTGVVVDVRQGSGLIQRCPECNRAILNGECVSHGTVEPVLDLRLKLVLDDGTGAMNVHVGRELTEKLTGVTLDAAVGLAKARGDPEAASRGMAGKVIIKQMKATGNVLSDEFGPMMIAREAEFLEIDIDAEAKKLLSEMEATI